MSIYGISKETGRVYEIIESSYGHGLGWCYLVRSVDFKIKPFYMGHRKIALIDDGEE